MHERSGACYFAATLAASGELLGFVGLKRHVGGSAGSLPFAPCTDIGWRLAARACQDVGFRELGLEEIVSFTVPANLRSRALMEKLGMHEDAGGAFAHPALPAEHALSKHVLYRLRRAEVALPG